MKIAEKPVKICCLGKGLAKRFDEYEKAVCNHCLAIAGLAEPKLAIASKKT